MSNDNNSGSDGDYWGRAGLGQSILDALAAAGKDLDALTIDDLAPMDHFHGGGKPSTTRLAQLAGLNAGSPRIGRGRQPRRTGEYAGG